MKRVKLMMVAAFMIAVGSSFATQENSSLVNNRRNASCALIEGTCIQSGEHLCDEQEQYDKDDASCSLRFNKKP